MSRVPTTVNIPTKSKTYSIHLLGDFPLLGLDLKGVAAGGEAGHSMAHLSSELVGWS